jgi:putative peptidoglycan lipid II flippase
LIAFVMLAVQIAAGIAVYGLLLQILGAASWRETVNALKRPA